VKFAPVVRWSVLARLLPGLAASLSQPRTPKRRIRVTGDAENQWPLWSDHPLV